MSIPERARSLYALRSQAILIALSILDPGKLEGALDTPSCGIAMEKYPSLRNS